MNRIKSSILVTALLLAIIILSILCILKSAELPEGADMVKELLSGCESTSTSKVTDCLSGNVKDFYSFSSCVTTEDYLKECGISFDFMSEENCELKKVYLIGTDKSVSAEKASEILLFGVDCDIIGAYIGADYIDADGVSCKAVTRAYVGVTEGAEKILFIE